jgi:carbonic anhydrase
MADINIDAVRKKKKAEYNKQYRLKRKLLLQTSTSTETELAEKQKKAEYAKQYRLKRVCLTARLF